MAPKNSRTPAGRPARAAAEAAPVASRAGRGWQSPVPVAGGVAPLALPGAAASVGPFDDARLALAGVLVVALAGVVLALRLAGRLRGDDGDGAGEAAGAGETREVTVEMVDEERAEPASVFCPLRATELDSGAERRARLSDGRAKLSLPEGRWRFVARFGDCLRTEQVTVAGPQTVRLAAPNAAVTLAVADADTGDPVPGAELTCATGTGSERRAETGDDGEASVSLPVGATVEVRAEHDRYAPASDAATVERGGEGTLRLAPRTGDVEVGVEVDGEPTAGVPVEVVAREDAVRAVRPRARTATTGEDGRATVEDLLVGEYEIRTPVADRGQFEAATRAAKVYDDSPVRTDLEAAFTYDLGAEQQGRLSTLRDRLDARLDRTARAAALPAFYAGVVEATLDAAERVPREGAVFAADDDPPAPSAVVDGLLDAAAEALPVVEAATPPSSVRVPADAGERPGWEGDVSAAGVLAATAADPDARQRRLRERLAPVETAIEEADATLVTVAPVRAAGEVAREMARADRSGDPVGAAAASVVAAALAGAVRESLTHPDTRRALACVWPAFWRDLATATRAEHAALTALVEDVEAADVERYAPFSLLMEVPDLGRRLPELTSPLDKDRLDDCRDELLAACTGIAEGMAEELREAAEALDGADVPPEFPGPPAPPGDVGAELRATDSVEAFREAWAATVEELVDALDEAEPGATVVAEYDDVVGDVERALEESGRVSPGDLPARHGRLFLRLYAHRRSGVGFDPDGPALVADGA